jgi:hypothetical protein
VTFIDECGEALLERLASAGARFIATEPLTRLMVDEAQACGSGDPERKRRPLTILMRPPWLPTTTK